jgi:hypothetical protein
MRYLGVVALFVAVVAGCAAPPGSEGAGGEGAGSDKTSALEPSSVACPQVEGVDLPPECIPYDPEAFMDANEAYKDRIPVSEKAFAGFEVKREEVEVAIAALQASDDVTIDSVADVLETAGLGPDPIEPVRTWENVDGVHFMAGGPTGGCVEGTVTVKALNMALKGYVNDGGCIALSGH